MFTTLIAVALAATQISAIPQNALPSDPLAAVIAKQREISLRGVFDNIGPNGVKAPGASAGIVIASPSTEDPDYFFTWSRDAALTLKMIVDEFLTGNKDVESTITDYIKSQAILQAVSNPSGSLSSGRGLGEPKYYANQTRFNRSWGRPQRDGPALRATAIIAYARRLVATGRAKQVRDTIWPVLRNDLNYVAEFWNSTGFDLWEEVNGRSFFTTAAQHRALVEGANLAKKIGLSCPGCESQAPNILCLLQTYWNGKYVVANMGINAQRTGIDANTVLGSIASFDPVAYCTDETFQPCSHRALANLKVYIDAFRTEYAINAGIPSNTAVATGRYTEDVYYNGNPWYLTTLAVAEQLYDAVQQWRARHNLFISDVDLPFWQSIYPAAKVGQYNSGTPRFNALVAAALKFADGFVEVANKYTPSGGALAEQYDRNTGAPLSARDLTWSYASYVTMAAARRAALILTAKEREPLQVPSWGERGANKPPAVCVASSVPGNYTPAVGSGAPPGSGGCTVTVTFNVNATTFYGENIYLFGNTTDLGAWSPSDGVPGNAGGYTSERPLWDFEVDLPASDTLSYQYLRSEPDGSFLYETVNRTVTVPPCGTSPEDPSATVEDAWTGPTGVPP